ncbi:MAG: sugar phosphate isomerase/epimerase [Burkholderiales bacterium]|nr:sugar phosphate isomerase/epimerase [Burkholderiales bacterium]
MSPLSLSPLTVLPASPLDVIDAAHAAGLDAVGLRLQPVLPTDLEVMTDAALMRAIERRLATTGLTVLDIEVFRIGARTDIAAMQPAMAFAAALGARFMLCTSGLKNEHGASADPATIAKLGELCELGARLGIRPMLEFMIFRSLGSLEDAVRMVQQVGHPNLGICLDALHLARSGGTPRSLCEVDPALIGYAQICDAPAAAPAPERIPEEARFDRLYPGEGGLPLAELLRALPPGIPLALEAPSRRHANLSPAERACAIARSMRGLLEDTFGPPSERARTES